MDKCCDRAEVQATHWEGCHTEHPECAAYRAGWEAGMREAATICERFGALYTGLDMARVILSAIEEKK